MSASDDNPGAKKKPKEDFFKPPVDAELSERFHKELIKHIAQTCTSFQQYGKSFQRVIDVLTKRVKVKHPNTLSRMVDKEADELMEDITAIIKTVKADLVSLGFTTDLWTSRALDSFISLTLSFIDRLSIIIKMQMFSIISSGIGSCTDGLLLSDTSQRGTLARPLPSSWMG